MNHFFISLEVNFMSNTNSVSKNIKCLVYTAVLTAMTTALTFIHIPAGNGYIHVGDSIIYLASMILPFPFGIVVGSFGGALADALSGYVIYVIPTFIVKAVNSLCFYIIARKSEKILCVKSIIAMTLSSLVTIFGYYFVAVILYAPDFSLASFKSQLVVIPGNIIQAVSSAVLFIAIGTFADKISLKSWVRKKL